MLERWRAMHCLVRCPVSVIPRSAETLWFGPQIDVLPFRTFFSTASGFGTIELDRTSLRVHVIEGELALEKVVLGRDGATKTLDWKTVVQADSSATKTIG